MTNQAYYQTEIDELIAKLGLDYESQAHSCVSCDVDENMVATIYTDGGDYTVFPAEFLLQKLDEINDAGFLCEDDEDAENYEKFWEFVNAWKEEEEEEGTQKGSTLDMIQKLVIAEPVFFQACIDDYLKDLKRELEYKVRTGNYEIYDEACGYANYTYNDAYKKVMGDN